MSDMFWIALELSIPKIRFNFMLSLTVKKLDAFKFDGVAESDNTDLECSSRSTLSAPSSSEKTYPCRAITMLQQRVAVFHLHRCSCHVTILYRAVVAAVACRPTCFRFYGRSTAECGVLFSSAMSYGGLF